MADTAINIATRVAQAQGLRAPTSLRSNQDVDAGKLLALLNRGCRTLATKRGPFGGSWQELVREHLITTQPNVESYPLPQGFSELINDTVWDRSTYREAPGPLTPQEHQRLKGGLLDTVAITPRYRLAFDENEQTVRFFLDPIPSGEETIAFEYLSSAWARESPESPVTLERITNDTQIPVFPDNLVELDLTWRLLKSNGLNYRTDIAEFEMERDKLFAQSGGLRTVHMAPVYERDFWGANTPESGFGGV